MLGAVEAADLLLGGHPQTDRRLDGREGRHHHADGPCEDGADAEGLDAQKRRAAGVDQAFEAGGCRGVGEQAHREGSPDTVRQMHADGADRVIDVQLEVERLDYDDDEDARDDAHDGCPDGIESIASGRDAHEACKGAVEAHRHIGFAGARPREDHRGDRGNGGGDGRGDEDRCERLAVPCCGAVEAVPAEPKQEAAQGAERDRVTGNGVDLGNGAVRTPEILAQARTHHDGADQGRDAAHRVDGRRPGEVVEAHLGEPTLRVPNPACFDGVDKERERRGIDAVREELGALGHGARDDRGGGGAEHQVEDERRGIAAFEERPEIGEYHEVGHADEPEEVVLRHHEAESQQHEDDGSDAEVHQVLHDDVACILGAGEARLDHGEARLHEKDERCAD